MSELRDFVVLHMRGRGIDVRSSSGGAAAVAAPPPVDASLRRALRPLLKELALRYDDLDSIDRIVAAQSKVAAVVDAASRTLKHADERSNLLEDREAQSAKLLDSSKRLFSAMQVRAATSDGTGCSMCSCPAYADRFILKHCSFSTPYYSRRRRNGCRGTASGGDIACAA